MQRDIRLTGSRRFSQIYKCGSGWANDLLVLKVLANDSDITRFGLVTARRVGNAVVRNKIRRRLKEILRKAPVEMGWDLVFIARKRRVVADYWQLEHAAYRLLRRAGLVETSSSGR